MSNKRGFHKRLVRRKLFPVRIAHGRRAILRHDGIGRLAPASGRLFRRIGCAATDTHLLRVLPYSAIAGGRARASPDGALHCRARQKPPVTPATTTATA